MSSLLHRVALVAAVTAALTSQQTVDPDAGKRDLERRQRREDFLLAVGKPPKRKKPSVRAKKRAQRRNNKG